MFAGTDIHKKIIKQQYSKPVDLEETSQLYWMYLNDAIRDEVNCDVGQVVLVEDFFLTVRRVILRTMTYEMIGSVVVDMYNAINATDFISDFMIFQDLVEDCTAKAAVCPTWLASVLFLKDCERKRLKIVSRLSFAMKRVLVMDGAPADEAPVVGKWLRAVYDMRKTDDTRLYNFDDIGDFTVGLLFAGHKNPSISAAQVVLYTLEFDTTCSHPETGTPSVGSSGSVTRGHSDRTSIMTDVYTEAKFVQERLASGDEDFDISCTSDDKKANTNLLDALNTCDVIDRIVVETLRVTAHSIGAVRKVMAEGGWKVSVEDERNPSSPAKQYILPFGSYVGVSHIIPHRDQFKYVIQLFIYFYNLV